LSLTFEIGNVCMGSMIGPNNGLGKADIKADNTRPPL
jgi:hypothetical protein